MLGDGQVDARIFDGETVTRFASALMRVSPSPCAEVRVFSAEWRGGQYVPGLRFSRNYSGWFREPFGLANKVADVSGVSVYVTVNPVNKDIGSRHLGSLREARKGEGTEDRDIASLAWLYLDIDAKRPSGIGATDEELRHAIGTRDRVLDEVDGLRESSMWGCSGNGGWILARLPDYTNDAASKQVIDKAYMILSARFSDGHAFVDPKTKNPGRIMCLPGTRKCKGSDVQDRPWRLVTLDSPERELPGFDLKAWTEGQGRTWFVVPDVIPAVTQAPSRSSLIDRARAYVDTFAPSVSGSNGHGQTFDVAQCLVIGFGLSADDARPIIQEYSRRCLPPWSDAEIEHKLKSADEKPDQRGYLLRAEQDRRVAWAASHLVPSNDDGIQEGLMDETNVPEGSEDNPHRLAKMFLSRFRHHDGHMLRYWNADFHVWDGGAYRMISKDEMRSELSKAIEVEFIRIYNMQLMQYGMGGEGKPPRPIPVTTRLVGDVLQALGSNCLLRERDYPSQPAWIDAHTDWAEMEMMPTRNSLVHLPSYAEGREEFYCEPTPKFFSPYCLAYDFQPEAPEPVNWLTFLGARDITPDSPVQLQLWKDDPETIAMLQEWMGLLLIPDTSYQKIGCLIGPPRSGKGTIAKVIRAMIGEGNCAGPTLSSFGTNFGLSPLIGKLAAIIDDARLSSKTDQAQITERLLTISGEGMLTIDRKHREPWNGSLRTRITFISNELPRLADSSTALPNRLLIMRCRKSFLGMEDPGLEHRLFPELPGILLWAIEGLRRLKERRRFVQPKASRELIDEMEELASPISAFLRDCCELTPYGEEEVQTIYRAWCAWCGNRGVSHPGDSPTFGRNLRSIMPDLQTAQARRHGAVVRIFKGLCIVHDPSMAWLKPDTIQDVNPDVIQIPVQGDLSLGNDESIPF